ncbi:hypothetical protein BH23ACT11_BH23ACT11_09790 [soil metagenome]
MKHWNLILDDLYSSQHTYPPLADYNTALEKFRLLVTRRRAHSLLEKMPDQGITEAYETLKDMYEFYASRSEAEWSPSLVQETVSVNFVKSYDRPEFPVAEE